MSSVLISGGIVLAGRELLRADITIDESTITSIDEPSPRANDGSRATLDATGCSVLPGFVDVQVNGAAGVDLTTEPGRIGEVAAILPQFGVTSFMPTVITASATDMSVAIAAIRTWASGDDRRGARSLGVHLEGPYLNSERAGAHPVEHLRASSTQETREWSPANGVAMVTLAPELPGAFDVISNLVGRGVVVCAGHTTADPSCIAAARSIGLTGVTHLFNAMGVMSARSPGPAGATLADDELLAGLIVDLVHVDPAMVKMAWRALGADRVVLVTDCIAALGLGDGSYMIGDTAVTVTSGRALTSTGTLAGSTLQFDQAVRNLIAITGCALAEASCAASSTPARLAQRTDIGRLAAGCTADVVLLDGSLHVVATMVNGNVVFDPEQRASAATARTR